MGEEREGGRKKGRQEEGRRQAQCPADLTAQLEGLHSYTCRVKRTPGAQKYDVHCAP